VLGGESGDFGLFFRQCRGFDAVGFGQNQLVRHGGVVEQFHHHLVGGFQLDAGVEEEEHTLQVGAAA
jgi:hypothetical protein